MNTKTPELLPCPWCGGADVVDEPTIHGMHALRCTRCATQGPECGTSEEAVEAWNTRHFGRTLTNEIGASTAEHAHEAAQTVIDNEAALVKRRDENQG